MSHAANKSPWGNSLLRDQVWDLKDPLIKIRVDIYEAAMRLARRDLFCPMSALQGVLFTACCVRRASHKVGF